MIKKSLMQDVPEILIPFVSVSFPPLTPRWRRVTVNVARLLILSMNLSSTQITPLEEDLECRGMKFLNKGDYAFAHLNLITIAGSAKNPGWRKRSIEKKVLSFFPMAARLIHKYLSIATITAIQQPIAAAVCLVAWRAQAHGLSF